MKTLVIYPGSSCNTPSMFYLIDPDTGEILGTRFCSEAKYAKGDLYDYQPIVKQKMRELYGNRVVALFVDVYIDRHIREESNLREAGFVESIELDL